MQDGKSGSMKTPHVAVIVGVLMVLGNVFVRGRLPPRINGGAVDLKCFGDARFSWATVGISCEFCCVRGIVIMY